MCCLEETSAALLSSQVVTMSGPCIPVTSSTPVVRGGAGAAERSYPRVKDTTGTRTMFIDDLLLPKGKATNGVMCRPHIYTYYVNMYIYN